MWMPLVLGALLGVGSRGEQPSAVPSPSQVVVTSENFKTIVHWQYPPTSETPRFVVEVKSYLSGSYKIVSTCVNISAHFCDVSKEIDDVFDSHWFQVKAVVGSQESEYVETNEFILQRHGKIGPPKLNLSRHGDKIMVDIYHPAFPSMESLPLIGDLEPVYSVTFWDSKNQSKEEFSELPEDNCTMYKCSFMILIPAEGSTYCVSVKGKLYNGLMALAPSEESCIHVHLKQISSITYIIVLCSVILSLSLILTTYLCCKRLKKRNIKLPKSLVAVIRNLNTDILPESKYVSVVSIMPAQSALSVMGEETCVEVEPEEEAVSPEISSEKASSVPPLESPAIAEEVSVQESTEEASSDDEQNHKVKESYFTSSSQMDVCSNSSGPEVSAPEIQQATIPSSSLKFSGYDKPHVPLEMLIDVGEEQPVIAYRPTD
ncbi:interferon gamma receptor 1 isoform X2 [Colius striatus]|uniref:interferon gamma receptor 1 isoform X2 n=1 Tax=Colius striatus TaxID=57412 RepID=UPI002B1D23C1|nr:interferon gamma receptor 1 isoform X2 [Colius striatus]